jgi:DNA-binding NarL/FixJ family response regulator
MTPVSPQHEPTAPGQVNIVLVDDQRYARVGFSLMIRKDPALRVAAEAENGQDAITAIARLAADGTPPDIVLMDVRMPVLDGIDATRMITRRWPAVKVLILTTYDEDDYAFGGLRAGASGFLLKDVRAPQLAQAIHAVAHGDAVLTPRVTREVVQRGIPKLLPDAEKELIRTRFDTLTPRERDIVQLIADGLSNTEIAGRLVLEPASIRRNVSRILNKLHLRDRVQIAINWYRISQ